MIFLTRAHCLTLYHMIKVPRSYITSKGEECADKAVNPTISLKKETKMKLSKNKKTKSIWYTLQYINRTLELISALKNFCISLIAIFGKVLLVNCIIFLERQMKGITIL